MWRWYDDNCQTTTIQLSWTLNITIYDNFILPIPTLHCWAYRLFSLIVGVALTPEAVTEAVKEVEWKLLCICLCVPDSKCDEIKSQYPAKYHRKVLVDWWFSTDPAPSWRRLVYRLDVLILLSSETVEKIRCNVEPVQGTLSTLCMYVTCSLIQTAFNSLE